LKKPGIFGNSTFHEAVALRQTLSEYIRVEIDHRKQHKIQHDATRTHSDLLDIMLEECPEKEDLITDAVVASMFGAVANTNAAAINIVCHLIENPEHLKSLEEEIVSNSKQYDCQYTWDSCHDMKFLQGCINEATRLYAIPLSMRSTLATSPLTHDFTVSEGRTVAISSNLIMKDESLFPNAESFNPCRWIKELDNDSVSTEARRMYFGFGHGVHMCKGMVLAQIELKMILSKLINEYELISLKYSNGTVKSGMGCVPEMEWVSLGMAYPKDDVKLIYRKRPKKLSDD